MFRSCKKDFYKDSGKSQVGCLRTGRRHEKWPNQYKSSLHFSLPLSHLCYCNQFCLACVVKLDVPVFMFFVVDFVALLFAGF